MTKTKEELKELEMSQLGYYGWLTLSKKVNRFIKRVDDYFKQND